MGVLNFFSQPVVPITILLKHSYTSRGFFLMLYKELDLHFCCLWRSLKSFLLFVLCHRWSIWNQVFLFCFSGHKWKTLYECVRPSIFFPVLGLVMYLVFFLNTELGYFVIIFTFTEKNLNPNHSEEDWETMTPQLIRLANRWQCDYFELLLCYCSCLLILLFKGHMF